MLDIKLDTAVDIVLDIMLDVLDIELDSVDRVESIENKLLPKFSELVIVGRGDS